MLVVEDDRDIRDLLKEALETEGYTAETAVNGREGVEKLGAMPRPCLILLDMMMPVMNGWEFLKVVRDDVYLAAIPIVVVSAAGEPARDTGADGFIRKPVDLDLLMNVVKQYCG